MSKLNDEHYMKMALRLARRGLGKTSPNPMVGAVIVKNGRVIGKGYHERFGGPHAEINAIKNAGGKINGATLYVTLEPCCHQGKKTPPCLDTLLKYKWRRVVIGTTDPNPRVNGRSVGILKQRGIKTRTGVLDEECQKLNEVYFKYIQTGMPFVTLKCAQTLDGRIATTTGDSRWISSQPARKYAHMLRSQHDAVMVGVGTVLQDDPQLTVRLAKGRNPVRIVADSKLRIPLKAKILQEQEAARTIIATTSKADKKKLSTLKRMDIEVLTVKSDRAGDVDLKDLLEELGRRDISSVLAEGGAKTITSFLRQRLADRVIAIIAPKVMGKGVEAVGELGIRKVKQALRLSFQRVYRRGEDVIIEASFIKH